MKRNRPALWAVPIAVALLLSACAPSTATALPPSNTNNDPQSAISAAGSSTAPAIPLTPQPGATLVTYGPNPENFPADINPLTGQPVLDPTLLKIPAMLVSVSHFPATARPQAGLSFAPYVFEFSITEGQTRFLAAFYGQFPSPEVPLVGVCAVRYGVFTKTDTVLGNQVWLDSNRNGIQDMGEVGIPGICVNLYDPAGKLLQQTTTDSNGYYGFNVKAGGNYVIKFIKPAYLDFSPANIGDENHDSDVDPATGATPAITAQQEDLLWDSGMVPNKAYVPPTPDPKTDPKPQVGPVRSGRLLYSYIGGFFQDSCLMYAFASPEVLEKIPHCSFVAHEDAGGGSMLEIDRMKVIAEDNMRHTTERPFNYTSNVFSDVVPTGGKPATKINVFFGNLDQSGWIYDPLYQSYLRYVDTADKNAIGILHPEIDRLTGRQLHFENVVVIMADTDVVSRTNLDIHLDEGNDGDAYLFRDGSIFPINWSTKAGAYEKKTGFRRPIQFLNNDGSPAVLKPSHTWVTIITPFSSVQATQPGTYLVKYAPPEGEAQ